MIRTRLFWMAVVSVVVLAGVVSLSEALPQCNATGVVCRVQACSIISNMITQVTPTGRMRDPWSANDVLITCDDCGLVWASDWLGRCPTVTGTGGGAGTTQNCDVN